MAIVNVYGHIFNGDDYNVCKWLPLDVIWARKKLAIEKPAATQRLYNNGDTYIVADLKSVT